MSQKTFSDVFQVILERKKKGHEPSSYVASLINKGTDAILKKIAEETGEVIIAAKNVHAESRIHELTDLWFHMLVLMAHQGITLEDIEKEFGRRFGKSGIEEKVSRKET